MPHVFFVFFVPSCASWSGVLTALRPVNVRTSIELPSVSTVTAPSWSVRKIAAPIVSVALQHRRRGVAEVVRPAGADDRDRGAERPQELRAARGQAAVVRHLDDAERRGRASAASVALDCPADVAGQQHRHVAPAQLEHDRVVVPHLLPLPVGRRRMPRHDLDAVDRRDGRRVDVRPPRPGRLRLPARSAVSGSNGGTGIPSQTSRGRNSRMIDAAPPM